MDNLSAHDSLQQYKELAEGELLAKELCPFCLGGMGSEKSLSLRGMKTAVWFKCWRASCGISGFIPVTGGTIRTMMGKQPVQLSFMSRELSDTDKIKNGSVSDIIREAGWEWTDDFGGRVVIPFYDREGELAGHVLRSYNPSHNSKTLTIRIKTSDNPELAWARRGMYAKHVVIVEDLVSAERIARHTKFTAAAVLCGSLLDGHVYDLISARAGKIRLALDNDALASSVAATIKHRRLLPNMRSVRLLRDIKDMSDEEFASFASYLDEDFSK